MYRRNELSCTSLAVGTATLMPLVAGCQKSREERRAEREAARGNASTTGTSTRANRPFGEILKDGFTKPVPLGIFLAVTIALYIAMMMATRANVRGTFPPNTARITAWGFLTLLLLYTVFIHYGLLVQPGLPLLYQIITIALVLVIGIAFWISARTATS